VRRGQSSMWALVGVVVLGLLALWWRHHRRHQQAASPDHLER